MSSDLCTHNARAEHGDFANDEIGHEGLLLEI